MLSSFRLASLVGFLLMSSDPVMASRAVPSLGLEDWARQDVERIWRKSGFQQQEPEIEWQVAERPAFQIGCGEDERITIRASGASESERREQVYAALAELGFAFPHPRIQLSPRPERLVQACGRTGSFRARLEKRGFHLHTMHPSEWVNGFLMDDLSIADDTVRWLVRNQQNLLQVQVLRTSNFNHLRQALRLARDAGLEVGFSASFAMQQQKAFFLVPLWATFSGSAWKKPLREKLGWILENFEFDFLCAEMGTTEFTSTAADRTLEWMEETRRILAERGKYLVIKIHTSTGQEDRRYGNYNFLARHANPEVGVLPHTVMFYGLSDARTPMYGRKDFQDMRQFMLEESVRRPTWYYPETSYYVGMDIDVPIFLTDYLLARRTDFEDVVANRIEGHLNFTTGHELGYWLFDWNLALQAWPQAADDPWLALRLLGEEVDTWKAITSYQHEYFKNRQVIRLISSSNLMDELPGFHPIHERALLRQLHRDRTRLAEEIRLLEDAVLALPSLEGVRHPELRRMLEVTALRVKHALSVRRIIAGREKSKWREEAARLRQQAEVLLAEVRRDHDRYPQSIVFKKARNVTSYDEGYGLTAARLHFWKREEEMAANSLHAQNPFFMNFYSIQKLLF
jgi:hypothetical protein